MTRIGNSMRFALDFIALNPGVNMAEVDRACRTARGGHQWMYATCHRLLRANLVEYCPSASGRGNGLRATEKGLARI